MKKIIKKYKLLSILLLIYSILFIQKKSFCNELQLTEFNGSYIKMNPVALGGCLPDDDLDYTVNLEHLDFIERNDYLESNSVICGDNAFFINSSDLESNSVIHDDFVDFDHEDEDFPYFNNFHIQKYENIYPDEINEKLNTVYNKKKNILLNRINTGHERSSDNRVIKKYKQPNNYNINKTNKRYSMNRRLV